VTPRQCHTVYSACVERGFSTGKGPDPFRDLPGSKTLAMAILLTVVGGLILATGYVVDVNPRVLLAGLAMWVTGCLVVLGLAVRVARATGSSWLAALGQGIRTSFRWLWEFFP
jgi:hypothetical protein